MTITAYTGNSRESYLNWTRAWKAEYQSLSEEIRNIKQNRKKYIWEYRPKGTNAIKRKTILSENPNYNPNVIGLLAQKRAYANELLELRKEAKQIAAQQYLARMAELTAA